MFLDPRRFPFTATLERHWRDVRRELDALERDDFFDWHEVGGYSGTWQVCGVHTEPGHEGEPLLSPDVRARCPRTIELVREVPGVYFSAFSRMGPGSIIHPHRDGGPRAYRCHLGLHVSDACRLQVGDDNRAWEEGRCLVFDGSTMHAAWNHSERARDVLIVEFRPPLGTAGRDGRSETERR